MKREPGYYWVKKIKFSGYDDNQWFIARWDGSYFWIGAEDIPESCIGEIDENQIKRR
jgi:hypothetical protein